MQNLRWPRAGSQCIYTKEETGNWKAGPPSPALSARSEFPLKGQSSTGFSHLSILPITTGSASLGSHRHRTPQTQVHDFSKSNACFAIHNIPVPLHQVLLSVKFVLSFTSCKQVYCIWYGATFSSPFISTLIFSRMAPDTADLSVRFSEESKMFLVSYFNRSIFFFGFLRQDFSV